MLQDLAGDVQREIRRIHETADEREVIRQQILTLVHDQDTGCIQLQPLLEVLGVVVIRRLLRNEQQCVVRCAQSLGLGVDDMSRRHVVEELLGVELIVLLVLDVLLGLLPERNHGVERLILVDRLVFRLIVLRCVLRLRLHDRMRKRHADRIADVVGVLLDQTAQLVALQELVVVLLLGGLLDGQDNLRAVVVLHRFGDLKSVRTVGIPAVCLLLAACAGDDRDMGGDHERGVETDAELTDDVDILDGVVLLLELERSALRDDAEVVFQLVAGHADAVVLDGQCAGLLIRRKTDLIAALRCERGVGQRTEMALVHRVARVRDQLAQENLLVRVDRVNHHVQQTFGLRLELLLCHIYQSFRVIICRY